MSKISAIKSDIELAIIGKMMTLDRDITIDQIIEELEKQGIIKSGDSNSETGQVKTQPDGYIFEITEKNGDWEVVYIGKGDLVLPEIVIALTPNTTGLTDEVIITMVAKANSGIAKYTLPGGTAQTVADSPKVITQTFTATKNGTYEFIVVNGNGKTETKSITIDNILEDLIQISTNPDTYTRGNVTVTVTWPEKSSEAIKEIQIGDGSWQTVTGTSKQVILTENNTVTARVRNSSTDIKTMTATIGWIDRVGPTAPTISGGGEDWKTSRTISVTREATDDKSGVAYYEYYLSNNSTEPTVETEATGRVGTSASAKSQAVRLGLIDTTVFNGIQMLRNLQVIEVVK